MCSCREPETASDLANVTQHFRGKWASEGSLLLSPVVSPWCCWAGCPTALTRRATSEVDPQLEEQPAGPLACAWVGATYLSCL